MKEYDPDARCEKCGYDCVTTKYVPIIDYALRWSITISDDEDPSPFVAGEHLLRTCVRCGYHWQEETITVKQIDVRSEAG